MSDFNTPNNGAQSPKSTESLTPEILPTRTKIKGSDNKEVQNSIKNVYIIPTGWSKYIERW